MVYTLPAADYDSLMMWLRSLMTTGWLLAMTSTVLAAQKVGKAPIPKKGWVSSLILIGLLVVVMIASFKPSKRGHRD